VLAAAPTPGADGDARIALSATAAHVYTECARIWNPIHTDPAVAQRAGLPGLILHGTATLALAVSWLVAEECGGDPARVGRVAARFGAMVRLPGEIGVRVVAREAGAIRFEARTADGELALRDGCLVRRSEAA
jgi:acyl dehydratase